MPITYTDSKQCFEEAKTDPYCEAMGGFIIARSGPFSFTYVAHGGGVPRGFEVVRKYQLDEGQVSALLFEDERLAMDALSAGVELSEEERKVLNRR